MDPSRLVRLPVRSVTREQQDLAEIEGAISLVLRREARRVTLTALPTALVIAADALARAQNAGVDFALERDRLSGSVTIVVGPVTE